MVGFINIFTVAFLSLIGEAVIYNNIFVGKLNKIDYILMISINSFIYLLVYYLFPGLSSIFFSCMPMIYIMVKLKEYFICMIVQVYVCVVIVIADSLMVLSIGGRAHVVRELGVSSIEFWGLYIYGIVIEYVLSKLTGIFIKKYKSLLLKNIKSKYFYIFIILIICTTILFDFNINWKRYFDTQPSEYVNGFLNLIYGVIALVVCGILLFMVKKEERYKLEQMELKNLKEYTDNLEDLYTEMRKFRHDYINIISSIAAFIEEKDIDGLEDYFNSNIQPLNKSINRNNYKLGLLKNINLQEIKGLISAKVLRAQELGIDVIIDIVEVIDKISMERIDLVRSLGILLDNAIDAAMESEEKKMTVALIKKDKSIIIIISNTYGENILPIGKMFKQGVSSKGEDRGLGLSNLNEILERYKNISLDTYIQNKEFVQEICIYTN